MDRVAVRALVVLVSHFSLGERAGTSMHLWAPLFIVERVEDRSGEALGAVGITNVDKWALGANSAVQKALQGRGRWQWGGSHSVSGTGLPVTVTETLWNCLYNHVIALCLPQSKAPQHCHRIDATVKRDARAGTRVAPSTPRNARDRRVPGDHHRWCVVQASAHPFLFL